MADKPPSDSPMRDPVPMTDAEWEPFARATGIEPPFICPECGATYDDQPQTGCMFDGTPVEPVGTDGQTNGFGRPTDDGLGYG